MSGRVRATSLVLCAPGSCPKPKELKRVEPYGYPIREIGSWIEIIDPRSAFCQVSNRSHPWRKNTPPTGSKLDGEPRWRHRTVVERMVTPLTQRGKHTSGGSFDRSLSNELRPTTLSTPLLPRGSWMSNHTQGASCAPQLPRTLGCRKFPRSAMMGILERDPPGLPS